MVSRLVMDALQDNAIIHMFGNTTLEFKETYEYVNKKFRRENPRVPMIPSETENDFLNFAKYLALRASMSAGAVQFLKPVI